MTTFVHLGNAVTFSSNNGVWVHEEALNLTPEKLQEAIQTAFDHLRDPLLEASCYGGAGPLAKYSDLSFEKYLQLVEDDRISQAGIEARKIHTKKRRWQFNSRRPQLLLAMIEAGIPYICVHPDCSVTKELTIDHIVPVSRGGSDDVSNLQFLCLSHNSAKGDS